MELSDDGVYLILSHQAENTVTIYNTHDDEIVTVLETPSPRNVLGRDGHVIVADNVTGTISIFSAEKEWSRIKEIRLPKPGIVLGC